jgi:nitrite reductase (NO-forming)
VTEAGRRQQPGRAGAAQVLPAVLVLAYLAVGGVAALLGDHLPGGAWLSLHLVLLGAVSNAIVSWSGYFTAALLHAPPAGERAGLARTLALDLDARAMLRTSMAAVRLSGRDSASRRSTSRAVVSLAPVRTSRARAY